MKDEHEDWHEKKWKMRQELLNSMNEKELRAFINGYMMGQKKVFKYLKSDSGCGCGGSSCGCVGESCNCEQK